MKPAGDRLGHLTPEERALLYERLRRKKELEGGGADRPLPIEPRDRSLDPAPLSFAQQRLWFLDRLQPGDPVYNLPVAVALAGDLDPGALRRALQAVVDRHESLRTTFGTAGSAPVQVVAERCAVALPVVDLEAFAASSEKSDGSPEKSDGSPEKSDDSPEKSDDSPGKSDDSPEKSDDSPRKSDDSPEKSDGSPGKSDDSPEKSDGSPGKSDDSVEVQGLLREEAVRPFDLATGPLIRFLLLRLAPDRHVLSVVMHHIVSDAWSLGLLIRETAAAYQGEALLPLPVQYPDFAVWQRRHLSGEALERQLGYWRRQLAGSPAALELPADHPRPPRRTTAGSRIPVRLPPALSAALKESARQEGVTPFIVLLAALQALLHRWSGQDDLAVGTVVANRGRSEVAGLIGFFVNTLVLRGDLSGDPAFGELLGRLRTVALAAFSNQDLPFEKLVEEIRPERDPSRTPLFQVMLSLQNTPLPELRMGGVQIEPLPLAAASAKFDLSLALREMPGEEAFSGALTYGTDLFELPTALRLIEHLIRLLESALARPGSRLSELSLLSPAERHQLVKEWNDTGAGRSEPSALARFEDWAARTPDAPAVVDAREAWTFRELDCRAGALAAALRCLGVGPESRVGLFLDRGAGVLAAMLGVWKAGGAWVPLDPSHPADRLAFTARDAGLAALVSETALRDRRPAPGVPTVEVDGLAEAVFRGPDPISRALSRQAAYVLYTSGSTGRPKGAVVEHGALANYLAWIGGLLGGETLPAVTSPTFDPSLKQLFCPLLEGRPARILPEAVAARPEALLAELAAGDDGALNCVPALWSAMLDLVEAGRAPAPARLRRLFLGGEALPPDLLERTASVLPEVRIWNLYGPTEATANATAAEVEPGLPVTLGRPLTGMRAHVLDRHGHPVPANVPGELCLAGAGLARGCLGRPALTAERFVPDPFPETPGSRLYRTGDVVRRLPDGRLEFRGRTDHQVKVRGFRVELGEIEARLAEHPRVREAVVLAQGGGPGETRLAACVVPAPPADPEGLAIDLKACLRERLPEPMVPAAFIWLENIPRTTTGKPDRRMLAGVAGAAAEAAQAAPAFVAPRTPAEELLAGLWSELLGGAKRIGAFDDFFALGGHSLLATQLVSRIRESFGVDLPLALLFEGSTLSALAGRIEAAMRAGDGLAAEPIRPVLRDRPLPLSFSQERLWFLDRLQPGNAAYNLPAALRLRGEVRPALLEGVLREIVRRHESLRTLFAVEDGQPVQIVTGGEAALPLVDLAALPAAGEREEEVRRLLAAEVSCPFDLERGPLLRAVLLREGPAEHALLFDTHHIVSDGWSMGVLVREVTALYGAALAGRPSPLPELAIQYPDFAVWQRGWLSGEVLERQLGYWRDRLAGAPPLDLPADRPRPAVQGFRGDRMAFQLPPAAAEGLQRLARRSGSTLFMVLLAAFAAWLRRATGQEDLPVGTPIANRNRRETEGLIGFFVNTLVLRLDLAGDPAVTELLGRVRQTALGAYAHQDLPFERLVEALRPERRLSHNPLFQVVLALQNAPAGEIDLPGLTLAPLPFETRTAKFDLGVTFAETGGGLAGSLEYAADLFDAATARRFAGHLGVLLEALGREEDRHVSELPLLTPEERAQIQEWSDGGALGEARDPLDLFEEQVALRPEVLAVSFAGGSLSYAELNRQAARLAAILRERGVGPGSRVGLQVERSLNLAVGLLGIWKAGGAYVPLDPGLPEARLAFLLEDAEIAAVVTEELAAQAAQPGPAGLSERAEGHDLAYVIYTSGTTGRPKGVLVERRSLAATLAATRALFDFRPGDRTLCVAPFSFDIFLFELLSPLTTGGTAVLLPLRPALEMGTLLAALQGAAHFHAVPALMRQVLEAVRRDPGRFDCLRTLFTGGDAVPAELLAGLRETFPGAAVWELYGPTEAAILCTAWPAPAAPARSRLGRPLAGTRVEVRDPAGRPGSEPSPIGFPGEIRIGGAGVARGYWRRAELTAERFVEERGGRFYRSGDLGRWRCDGQLEFLGRIDRQVKVRGFRVELGEIESVLARHPAVREAAAAVAGERLVAYVVPAGPAEDLLEELRRLAQAELPDYMVPSAFVTLEALPLTAHGKLDRAALPAPEPAGAAGLEPPRTPTEEALAAIWSALLGVGRIGRESDFFELGGHSLLGIQAVSRLRDRFGVEVPVRALFEAPKLAALAGWIDERRGGLESASHLPPVTPVPRDGGDFPLSFAQERMWFLYQLDPDSPVYNMPAALRLTGRLDAGALAAALCEVVLRHEALRTTFPATVGEPRQRVSPAPGHPLAEVDLRALPRGLREAELAWRVGEEARRPFDLAAGPVMRAVLFREDGKDAKDRQDGGRAVLVLVLHHIVSDGWSMGVLVREVAALYREEAPGLPDLPVQYPDFAVWQRRRLQGETLERELAWWRERLAGEVPVLRLPADRPRPPVLTARGGRRRLALAPDLAARLEALSRREGATLFMTLLAGFQALLARLTGQDDVWVGSPVAARNRSELEGLIGFFVNTLVLRGDLSGDPAFRELIGRARETALGAFAHQDVPFEKLVEELRPERDASRTPLFQVMFALQNAPMPALDLGGLRLEPVEHDSGASRFDITMSLQEVPGRGILGTLEYSAALFDPTTMDRLAQCYQNLLASAAEGDPRLSELGLLGGAERQQLLVEWNDSEKKRTGRTPGTGRTEPLHGLFLERAAATPEAPALRTAEASLPYRELAARASRLACHLIGLGVVPETRVGVCLPRSFDLIAGVLGVLWAGGAYVPLDPSYPRERLQWMLEDSGAAALVTLSGLAEDLAAPGGGRIELDRLEGGVAVPPAVPVDPDSLAYVIYTSGSTGRPKGVLATHRGVANTVLDTVDRLRLGPGERFLQFASLSFDGSVAEIFSALASGACLCLIEHGTLPVGEHLAAALRDMEVTTALIPPSVLATLEHSDFPHLHTLNVSAEKCPAETVRRWAPGRRFLNLYGPTEASVYMTVWEAGPEETTGPPPIGRPIANSRACVVDAAGNPMPLGVPGELLIGGACLARGYLDRPDLTAELFIPDPHPGVLPVPDVPPVPGGGGLRLYRTGDLCRFRPDGHLEMLGRLDHQVKVRGFRIELGEIEAALARHPAVESAVVLARQDVPGDPRLVAYVVPAAEGVEVQELRDGLAASLPHYMVPGFFVLLPELPITANGKVDRRRLPAPERPPAEAAFVPPGTAAEQALVRIWSEVLGVARVGATDSFFDLGGHSLLLPRIQARVREDLGREVPLLKLIEHPTVATLAAWLDQGLDPGAEEAGLDPASRDRVRRQRQALDLQRQRLASRTRER